MRPRTDGPASNADCSWDVFDPVWYSDHNYRLLRDDDREILQKVQKYLAETVAGSALRGIDVGPGANLYPSLAMLPFCREITLWEHSASNIEWLQQEITFYSETWNVFWDVLKGQQPYASVSDPREALRQRSRVHKGDLFSLSRGQWDIGMMFFVAESITERTDEFHAAIQRFVTALTPRSPFAATFMRNSVGYTVNTHRFPAVAVTEEDIERCFQDLGCRVDVSPVDSAAVAPLRAGYDGMILALGVTGEATS